MKRILTSIFLFLITILILNCSSESSTESEDTGMYSDITLSDTISDTVTVDIQQDIQSDLSFEDIGDTGIEDSITKDIETNDVIEDIGEDTKDIEDDIGRDIEISDDGGNNENIEIISFGREVNEEGTGIFSEGDNIYITGISYNQDYSASDMLLGIINGQGINFKTRDISEFDMNFGIAMIGGNIYTGGYTGSSGVFSGNLSQFDLTLYNIKTYDYKFQSYSTLFRTLNKIDESNILLTGFVNKDTENDALVYIVDTNGEVKKSRVFEKDLDQEFYAADIDKDGNILIAGIDIVDKTNWMDIYIVKLDKDLNIVWEKRFGSKELDGANSIRSLSSGDILVSGYTDIDNSTTGRNGYALLLDSDGNKKSEFIFKVNGDEEIRSAIETPDGNLLFVTIENIYDPFSSSGDLTLSKTDINWNVLNKEVISPTATASSIIPYKNGYVIIGTMYDPPPGQGESDILVVKVKEF